MTTNDLAENLQRNLQFVQKTLDDFSDAEMLVRPCPSANHAAWQVGHLIVAEVKMTSSIQPGAMPELPAGVAEKFTPETSKIDDATAFPGKAQLLDLFASTRQASIRWVKSLSPQDLARPVPERIKGFAANLGQYAAMIPVHVSMHLGQIQVIRRRLGKPILF